jgi:hypothetical protein
MNEQFINFVILVFRIRISFVQIPNSDRDIFVYFEMSLNVQDQILEKLACAQYTYSFVLLCQNLTSTRFVVENRFCSHAQKI